MVTHKKGSPSRKEKQTLRRSVTRSVIVVAGLTEAESETQAKLLATDCNFGIENSRAQFQRKYQETKRVMDEQIRDQKDSMDNSKREAADKANQLRGVIAGLGQQLQASQDLAKQTTSSSGEETL